MDSNWKGKLSLGEILILPTWQGSHPPFHSPHITHCTLWHVAQVEEGGDKVETLFLHASKANKLYELLTYVDKACHLSYLSHQTPPLAVHASLNL